MAQPQWGKFSKKEIEEQQQQEQEPEPEQEPELEQQVQPQTNQQVPVDADGNPLTKEQIEAIQVYYLWKRSLPEYEKADLYRMLMDVLSELIALETYDLDDRIDFLIDSINEVRAKIGMPEVEEPEDYDEDEEEGDEDEEDGLVEGGDNRGR